MANNKTLNNKAPGNKKYCSHQLILRPVKKLSFFSKHNSCICQLCTHLSGAAEIDLAGQCAHEAGRGFYIRLSFTLKGQSSSFREQTLKSSPDVSYGENILVSPGARALWEKNREANETKRENEFFVCSERENVFCPGRSAKRMKFRFILRWRATARLLILTTTAPTFGGRVHAFSNNAMCVWKSVSSTSSSCRRKTMTLKMRETLVREHEKCFLPLVSLFWCASRLKKTKAHVWVLYHIAN